jgi:NAD(P)-dependent dehydrogenase (short-subunit alcohol dehydrogenase family)
MTAEEFDQVVGVNLRGAFLSISASLPTAAGGASC